MERREIEAVLGHEMTHVANGDMVTMALVQGVVNAFALYLAYVVSRLARVAFSSRDGESGRSSFLGVVVERVVFYMAQIVFTILGSLVTAAFSRYREFRADAGAARLAGREGMIAALRRLLQTQQLVDTSHASLATFKIAGGKSMLQLLATHPPLEQRIAALEAARG
jgi:heat shock protein HtpX